MHGESTMVQVGAHRIEANVFGSGSPAVVIEPALGGDAAAWRPFAAELGDDTTVVTYNRVPYGASSRATDGRTPADVARDLHGVLGGLDIGAPLVLVGHSIGGVYARAYAAAYRDEVAGMVLVESSHEDQRRVTRGKTPWKWRLMDFMAIPSIVAGSAESRRGGDRRSLIREFRSFRKLTIADRTLFPGDLGARPLVVMTRSRDDTIRDRGFWPAWYELHEDLARLSSNSRHVVSRSPCHYLNEGDPQLILTAIGQVVRSVRTSEPLGAIAQNESLLTRPAVGGASRVRDDRGERRDHQGHRRHGHGGDHRVPVDDHPGHDAQAHTDAHHDEVGRLGARRRLGTRLRLRLRRPLMPAAPAAQFPVPPAQVPLIRILVAPVLVAPVLIASHNTPLLPGSLQSNQAPRDGGLRR